MLTIDVGIVLSARMHANCIAARPKREEADLFSGRIRQVDPYDVPFALQRLCEILYRATGKRAIVLLDEYDTPLQEAWLAGGWDEAVEFLRPLFNATFKTNPYLERALLTGITRVAEESIFSDMNNPEVVNITSEKYASVFGFTEREVFSAMDEVGLVDQKGVKYWYDGFTFGSLGDIYNPWSITNYLDKHELRPYWANTSSNGLVSRLVRQSDPILKQQFEALLSGGTVSEVISDLVVFKQLDRNPRAIWSLLVASGYLKIVSKELVQQQGVLRCELTVTNHETMVMFDELVRGWFGVDAQKGSPFVRALLAGDLREMNPSLRTT